MLRCRSPGCRPIQYIVDRCPTGYDACVCSTSLGCAVVPDVKYSSSVSSAAVPPPDPRRRRPRRRRRRTRVSPSAAARRSTPSPGRPRLRSVGTSPASACARPTTAADPAAAAAGRRGRRATAGWWRGSSPRPSGCRRASSTHSGAHVAEQQQHPVAAARRPLAPEPARHPLRAASHSSANVEPGVAPSVARRSTGRRPPGALLGGQGVEPVRGLVEASSRSRPAKSR